MSLKIKISFSIIVALSIFYGGMQYYQSYQAEKKMQIDLSYSLGQLQIYNRLLHSYFDGKIKLENYDTIESDFVAARKLAEKLETYGVDDEAIKSYRVLREVKDRYKATLSKIGMSLLFIDKIQKQNSSIMMKQIYNEILKYGIEPKKDTNFLRYLVDNYQYEDKFKKHSLFIAQLLDELIKLHNEIKALEL